MQEMTSAHCTNTAEGYEKQLKDTRDQQLYYVGKMKDGRCWMLQNLALGKTSVATALTSADSNVSSYWSLPAALTSATSGSASSTAVQSWNFGKWVLATPLLTASCGTSGSIPSLTSCIKVGFVDVSDTTNFQPTYTATTGDWEGANATSSTLVAVNCTTWSGSGTSKICTTGTYDPHYLVGNYYSWNATTAGTVTGIASGEASGSICPKGWKLPTSGSAGELKALVAAYGVSSSISGSVSETTYNIAGNPLRLTRGGYVFPGYYVDVAGQNGGYWSSTPVSGSDGGAYRLYFNDSSVKPSNSIGRYLGYSVRCIAE